MGALEDNVFVERLRARSSKRTSISRGYADGREAEVAIQARGYRAPMAVWRDGAPAAYGHVVKRWRVDTGSQAEQKQQADTAFGGLKQETTGGPTSH